MHPKNTTDPLLSQETGRPHHFITTIAHEFHAQGSLSFCSVVSGLPCSAAINFASAVLQSASRICSVLIDTERGPAGLHAVMILIDQAKALVDSAVPGIERAEGFAPQSQSSLDRGAEVSA